MTEIPLELNVQDVAKMREQAVDFLLLDCREVDEHAMVSISGADLIPMSELQTRSTELAGQEERPIIVFCHLGMRSAQVAAWLRQQGFLEAQSMAGGIDAWAVEIDPTLPRY